MSGEDYGRKDTRRLWQRMRARYQRATLSVCRLLCTGCGEMIVQGCTGIEEYGRQCIRLTICDPDARALTVTGRDLVCLSYQPAAVRIQGSIQSVCFCRYDGEGAR